MLFFPKYNFAFNSIRKALSVVVLPFTLVFFSFVSSFAKEKPWDRGIITLTDGVEVAGEVRYDFKEDVVMHKNSEGAERRYTASEVSGFEYFDSKRVKTFHFITLPYADGKEFFELLLETPSVALLIRKDIGTLVKFNQDGWARNSERPFEEVFIVNSNGLNKYLVTNVSEFNIGWRIVKKNLIAEITEEKFSDVQQFAKQENLDLYNVNDLIEILKYYSSLVDN